MNVTKRHSYEPGADGFDISVFIDVFRASTSLLCLFHQGVKEVLLPRDDNLIPALLARDYLLVSEVYADGLDNSPSQILNATLTDKKIVLRTTNLTTAIVNHANFSHAVVAGFVNISAVAQYIKDLKPVGIEIVMASHFDTQQPAVEDASCASMLEGLLDGNQLSEIPDLSSIRGRIGEMKTNGSRIPDHYWKDLDIALSLDRVAIVPRIFQQGRETIRFAVD